MMFPMLSHGLIPTDMGMARKVRIPTASKEAPWETRYAHHLSGTQFPWPTVGQRKPI
jgi:hypothetical protein